MRQLAIMLALLLAIGGFTVAGCGSEEDKGGGLAEAAQNANETREAESVSSLERTRTTRDSALRRCVDVPKSLSSHIAAKLNVEGPGTLEQAQAVASQDTEVHYVAAEIHGRGIEGDDVIGTWAVNDFEAGTGVYAFDAVAKKYSDWPDADKAAPSLSRDDDGADAAQGCVRAQRP